MLCPKCGDSLSSATKVCPRCGYVVDDRIDQYLSDLEMSLREIKSLPKLSFGEYFSRNAYIMYALMTVVFFVVTLMTDAGLFLILTGIALVMLAVSLIRKLSLRRKNAESEADYRQLLVDIETLMRMLRSDYGESVKVRERLRDATSELKDIKHDYEANRRHSVKVWIIVMVLTVAVSVAGIVLLGMRDLDGAGAVAQASGVLVSFNC